MTETVLVYKGKEIAAYGFGDPHPFGTDRHDVFHAELEQAGLNGSVDFGHARPEPTVRDLERVLLAVLAGDLTGDDPIRTAAVGCPISDVP